MQTPEDIARTATVKWVGDVAKGHGDITTQSGKVSATYSFGTRFSGDPGSNPEELLAASHAACFTMALSLGLTRAGHAPSSIETTAVVHLHRIDSGFEISKIDLATAAHVTGLADDRFQEIAHASKDGCPISKALRAVPVSLAATLAS